MSTEKVKALLFYLFPLSVLFACVFTTCYGVDIDDFDTRLTALETGLNEIKTKLEAGKMIESVEPEPGGFSIKFTDEPDTFHIVNGAQGAQGARGENGSQWIIVRNNWYNNTTKTPTSYRAVALDGTDAKAPSVSSDGYWTFYEWNVQKKTYDTLTSKMPADTLMMYLVDFGDLGYYELYTPLQNTDGAWKINPDTGDKWWMIRLPKWKPDPEPALVFKFIGYAKVLKGDTVVQMLAEDLDLQYTALRHVHFPDAPGSPVSENNTEIWKWKPRKAGELVEGFYMAELENGSLAVVFSINNKSQEYVTGLGGPSPDIPFELRNTKNNPLQAIRLDSPQSFEEGIITKAGSNNDTVYFARMRNAAPLLAYNYSPVPAGPIYYRLVIDTLSSELSPYPLRIAPAPALTDIPEVQYVQPLTATKPSINATSGIYELPNDTAEFYHLGFTHPGNLFDHYIATTDTSKITLSRFSAEDEIIKRFRVDTFLLNPGDAYRFPLIVYKLLTNGVIYRDTVWIRTSRP